MTDRPPTMMSVHQAAINSHLAKYHEFLLRYAKTRHVVYGFVEGRTDPVFYRGFIENILPDDWNVELWPAGNKSTVLAIHAHIDWRRFPKKRVCFFIDRDLSKLIPERNPEDKNIYTTDGYSIENDIVRSGTIRRTLTEVCGLEAANHDELEQVCEQFERELEKFQLAMAPLMAWILYWRKNNIRANLNDIHMKHLFYINAGAVHPNNTPNGKADACAYIHDQCKITYTAQTDISGCVSEFSKTAIYRNFCRGKYLMWFLVEFCLSVCEQASTMFPSLATKPQMKAALSHGNAIQIIGNRARIPRSLRTFLNETFLSYINSRKQ